jgi:hypothetical protein
MKQRFLNQKLGKRASHRAELNKAKNLFKKSGERSPSRQSPAQSGAGHRQF